MPAAGLEPARGCPQQILSLPRLPFRHAGLQLIRKRICSEPEQIRAKIHANRLRRWDFCLLNHILTASAASASACYEQ